MLPLPLLAVAAVLHTLHSSRVQKAWRSNGELSWNAPELQQHTGVRILVWSAPPCCSSVAV